MKTFRHIPGGIIGGSPTSISDISVESSNWIKGCDRLLELAKNFIEMREAKGQL